MNKKVIDWLTEREKERNTDSLGTTSEIKIPRLDGTITLTPSGVKKEIQDQTQLGILLYKIVEEDLEARGII
jgi:hypothetical protein